MHHGDPGWQIQGESSNDGGTFELTDRDVSLVENIRRLQSEFELEEESEEENDASCFRPHVVKTDEPGNQEGRESAAETISEGLTGSALNETNKGGSAVLATGGHRQELCSVQDAREGEHVTWGVEGTRPVPDDVRHASAMFSSECSDDVRSQELEISINAPERSVGVALRPEEEPGNEDGDSDSERYDSLYQEHVRRQRDAAPENLAMEEELEEDDDRFEISQPESDSQQQPLVTNLSQRDQQFLASIRQLDQVELEEEDMSDASETDSDEER